MHNSRSGDRLMMLAESTKPFNVKRKASATSAKTPTASGNKLTMQDFVRMDPSYTPDIEHLVFPGRKRNPQQVAPAILPASSAPTSSSSSKTRSRLAEMFALSRHLQQRSADRDNSQKNNASSGRKASAAIAINRSVDSMLESRDRQHQQQRRWAVGAAATAAEEPVRSTATTTATTAATVANSVSSARRSPIQDADMAATRGPNVSVLHLRSTSEPWETSPTSVFTTVSTGSSRSYSSGRSTSTTGATGSYNKYSQPSPIHQQATQTQQRADSYTGDGYLGKSCNRELSPVRWCDREVDGVYLGRSGWVQVQHRSLDESRRMKHAVDAMSARRTGMKLAEYQHTNNVMVFSSPPNKVEAQRPAYLPLKTTNEYESIKPKTPSPIDIESFSPPSLTPIISPPPAFQDRSSRLLTKSSTSSSSSGVTRSFFGKAPFLPRSNAITDSDVSPPSSPPPVWKTMKAASLPSAPSQAQSKRTKTPSPVFDNTKYPRIPQTKSLEDTSATRRTKFSQKYESSSSSSQSQNQSVSQGATAQQFRSLDSYIPRAMPRLSENTDSSIDVYEDADDEDNNSSSINMSIAKIQPVAPVSQPAKISPSGRNSRAPYRANNRKSPVGSDTKATSPGTSSSSSTECLFPGHTRSPMRRTPPSRQQTQQYPVVTTEDPKVRRSRSLQLPEKKNYLPPQRVSPQHPTSDGTYRVVKVRRGGYEEELLDEEAQREVDIVTGFIYGSRSRAAAQALLVSRRRSPTAQWTPNGQVTQPPSVASSAPSMRSSASYPLHARSLDVETISREPYKKRVPRQDRQEKVREPRRPSPNMLPPVTIERRAISPNAKGRSGAGSGSSSSDYAVVLPGGGGGRLVRSAKSSGASTPLDDGMSARGETILTRPGSAPGHHQPSVSGGGAGVPRAGTLDSSQRSMSLPKSFLSHRQGGQFPWRRRGTESLGSSPGFRRRTPIETSQTAPVTPLHEGNRRRSPSGGVHDEGGSRRAKANSTPLLIDGKEREPTRKSKATTNGGVQSTSQQHNGRKPSSVTGNAESVLQKFRKTFSLRFQRASSRGSKEPAVDSALAGEDGVDGSGGGGGYAAVERSASPLLLHHQPLSMPDTRDYEPVEQKHSRFGTLIWRSSKERKKLNKAARSMKCNSGDSGIQIEMAAGCGGGINGIGNAGDSSESHGEDDDDVDDDTSATSPQPVRRRGGGGSPACDGDAPPAVRRLTAARPLSDHLNQILIDRFKAELRTRADRHEHVRRTHSDLGGQRIYHWEAGGGGGGVGGGGGGATHHHHRRLQKHRRSGVMSTSPSPHRPPPSCGPRKKPPDYLPIQMRHHHTHQHHPPYHRRGGGQLRRSLSQPVDIDKLSPIMQVPNGAPHLKGGSEDENDMRLPTATTSDDDCTLSDSESSLASLNGKKSFDLPMDVENVVILAEAVFDHVAIDAVEELAFRAGEVIEVLDTNNRDWWWGTAGGRLGWFPANSVRLRVSQEDTVEDCLASMAAGGSPAANQLRRRTSISLLSNDQVRTSVVRELVHTERDFVKVLQDVAEGYIAECRKRNDMFVDEQIDTIFINLEAILKFQTGFLRDLESCIDWEAPHKSCVGACFMRHKDGFKMYSDYCNSHPMATATLQELYRFNNYSKFFEACRLMRGLIEIPLDGYLLTPVQRICKYPLQLAELLKYTKPEHADYGDVSEALEAMKGVAVLINERKRRMESLEKIEAWQQRVDGWEGDDLIEASTQLIHQGEVVRVTTGMWTSNLMLFLFDRQLVYCKKDILKRNTYVYKGRVCLDTSEVIDVPDGKDVHLGVNLRHAIKLHSLIRDKWLLVCCRSPADKQRWLAAFADERRLVERDEQDGMEFPESSRHLAKIAARCQRRPPRKLRNKRDFLIGSTMQLNNTIPNNTNSLGRKMGTWFTFGGGKKATARHRTADVSSS